MKTYLFIITGDYNDGDYITNNIILKDTDKEFNDVVNVLIVLQELLDKYKGYNGISFDCNDMDNYFYDKYEELKQFDEDFISELLPNIEADYIHTLVSIEAYEIETVKSLQSLIK